MRILQEKIVKSKNLSFKVLSLVLSSARLSIVICPLLLVATLPNREDLNSEGHSASNSLIASLNVALAYEDN